MRIVVGIFIFTCLVICPLSEGSTAKCGVRTQEDDILARQGRITGGSSASRGEYPWVVSILLNGFYCCGGTIVNRFWILTAAHCVANQPPRNYNVKVGSIELVGLIPEGVIFAVKKIVVHPFYNGQNNDIAILNLPSGLVYGDSVAPVCLPKTLSYTGYLATAVGLGLLSSNGDFAASEREVMVPILKNTVCQDWYHKAGQQDVTISDTLMCAGYKNGGKDACYGDSGGPLLVTCTDLKVRIVGVISAGIGCGAPLLPGVYTRVSVYNKWIQNVTGLS